MGGFLASARRTLRRDTPFESRVDKDAPYELGMLSASLSSAAVRDKIFRIEMLDLSSLWIIVLLFGAPLESLC